MNDMRTGITALDYANKEHRLTDEIMINKSTGDLYYNDKNNTIHGMIDDIESDSEIIKKIPEMIYRNATTELFKDGDGKESMFLSHSMIDSVATIYTDGVVVPNTSSHTFNVCPGHGNLVVTMMLRVGDKSTIDAISSLYYNLKDGLHTADDLYEFTFDLSVNGLKKTYKGRFNSPLVITTYEFIPIADYHDHNTENDILTSTSVHKATIDNFKLINLPLYEMVPAGIKNVIYKSDKSIMTDHLLISTISNVPSLPYSDTVDLCANNKLLLSENYQALANKMRYTGVGSGHGESDSISIVSSLDEATSNFIFLKPGDK